MSYSLHILLKEDWVIYINWRDRKKKKPVKNLCSSRCINDAFPIFKWQRNNRPDADWQNK